MPDCQLLPGCIFFNDKMANKPAMSELMKDRYCRGDQKICARFVVFEKLGRPSVPADMYPGQMERAQSILSSREKE